MSKIIDKLFNRVYIILSCLSYLNYVTQVLRVLVAAYQPSYNHFNRNNWCCGTYQLSVD